MSTDSYNAQCYRIGQISTHMISQRIKPFPTSSLAHQVDGGVTRDDVRYRRLAYYDREAERHAFAAMPQPAGPPWDRSARHRSISDRMAFTAAAAETERLGCSRSRLYRRTRHSAVRAAIHSAEVAVAHRGLGACSKSRDMEK